MQRGTTIALAVVVLAAGVSGAVVFRKKKPPPADQDVPVASGKASGQEVLDPPRPDSSGRPVPTPLAVTRLLGRIDLAHPEGDPAGEKGVQVTGEPPGPGAPGAAHQLPSQATGPPPRLAPTFPASRVEPSSWRSPAGADSAFAGPAEGTGGDQRRGDVPRTHRIQDGDTLSHLARRYLGASHRFLEIYELNRERLPSPDLLPIGVLLAIPDPDRVPEAAPDTQKSDLVPVRPARKRPT